MTPDTQEVAALRSSILSAATGEHLEVTVHLDQSGVEALVQASADLAEMLLRWVAAERDEALNEVAAALRADLLLLDLSPHLRQEHDDVVDR